MDIFLVNGIRVSHTVILAADLRLMQCKANILDQLSDIPVLLMEINTSGRDREIDHMTTLRKNLVDLITDFLVQCFSRILFLLMKDPRNKDCHLISAHTVYLAGISDNLFDTFCHIQQNLIADLTAAFLIDLLEIIDTDLQQISLQPILLRHSPKLILQGMFPVQTGHTINLTLLADIGNSSDQKFRLSICVIDNLSTAGYPYRLSIPSYPSIFHIMFC